MNVDDLIRDLKSGLGMVRVNAAMELGKVGGPLAEKALIEALGDQNMAVRNNAAFALGESKSQTAVPALLSLLRDPEERVRKSAVKALGMINAKDSVSPLIAVLETDQSRIVRKSAIRSLGQIGGPVALRAVESFITHGDTMLADVARKAVETIKGR